MIFMKEPLQRAIAVVKTVHGLGSYYGVHTMKFMNCIEKFDDGNVQVIAMLENLNLPHIKPTNCLDCLMKNGGRA